MSAASAQLRSAQPGGISVLHMAPSVQQRLHPPAIASCSCRLHCIADLRVIQLIVEPRRRLRPQLRPLRWPGEQVAGHALTPPEKPAAAGHPGAGRGAALLGDHRALAADIKRTPDRPPSVEHVLGLLEAPRAIGRHNKLRTVARFAPVGDRIIALKAVAVPETAHRLIAAAHHRLLLAQVALVYALPHFLFLYKRLLRWLEAPGTPARRCGLTWAANALPRH